MGDRLRAGLMLGKESREEGLAMLRGELETRRKRRKRTELQLWTNGPPGHAHEVLESGSGLESGETHTPFCCLQKRGHEGTSRSI